MKNNQNRIVAVIPARYGSTRFPGKCLALIKGKPMIQWVYERTRRSQLVNRVVVATDDARIIQAVTAFGGEVLMTSLAHQTGTDRIAEVVRQLDCDIVVNVQGDEPLIQPEMIDQAVQPLVDDASIPMSTLCNRIQRRDEAFDTNVVKVVFDKNNYAMYFSRAPIPWDRDHWSGKERLSEMPLAGAMYKHIGLYVYRREFLLTYTSLPQSSHEALEKLEQLRALDHGHKIKVMVTSYESFGVDIPDDLSKILKYIEER